MTNSSTLHGVELAALNRHYWTITSTQTKGRVLLHLPHLPHLPKLLLQLLLLHLPQIPLLLLHRHWRMVQQRRPSLSRLLMQQSRLLLGWLQTSSTTTWVHLSASPLLRCETGLQLTMLPDLPLLELQGSR